MSSPRPEGPHPDATGYGPPDAYRADSAAPERTALAWQRTALALVVAAAIVARLTVGDLGPVALAGGAAAAVAAGVVLVRPRTPSVQGAVPVTALTAAVVVVCALELAAVLLRP
ncbi:DUF202 domain-containing protein [Nocardioides zeae]|uniref:DUF202 domain-containing protein n=1 Tax=Nocardioides imazamoxiresistens TaxID=3231893 RepID=A0ABU3Q029_9ACTN|nr:DUF202 domain-containing protein [Nocardioides zeae]MDT9594860.1 DUF202 domain-containing protein [Nocardioides zeae]